MPATEVLTSTQLSFVATGVMLTIIAESGGTRHKAVLTLTELEYQIKLQIVNLIFWIAATLFGKMAVGLTILRILNKANKWHTYPVYFVIHFMNFTCILDTLLILFRCGDPGNLWNLRKQSRCLDEKMVYDFNIFAAAWQVFVDFFMAFFPMYVVWGLQMAPRRKYVIMTLLGLTTFTGVAASVKTAVAQTSLGATADSTWDIYVLAMWAATEIMLIIVCGSVPVIVPLWESLLKSRRQGYGSSSGGPSGGKSFKSGWSTSKSGWSKQSESAQRTTQDVENVDIEMSRLVAGNPKAMQPGAQSFPYSGDLPSTPYALKQANVDNSISGWR